MKKLVEIPCLGTCLNLTFHIEGRTRYSTYMAVIDDKQEQSIDKKKGCTIKVDDKEIIIPNNDIYAYGNIDFNEDSKDMSALEDLDLIVPKGCYRGEFIPISFDYEHNLMSVTTTETFDFAELCKFKYCQLGKPDKVVIFKHNRPVKFNER